MSLNLTINKFEGELAVVLSNTENIDEAREGLDSSEEVVELMTFSDPFERQEPMDVLSALFFHDLTEGSLGRAMEHVLTGVLKKGIAMGRAQAAAHLRQILDPPSS